MDHPILSDLCTACHTEKPKYRCPRCKAQTCSLQCYKKHQQRAACSGKRDPAAYVKKSQWATPLGIDQDYNYLKDVERKIDHSSKDVRQRGIGSDANRSKVATRGWQTGSMLQSYLTNNRISVECAPLGMSRQKTNHTRVTKGGHVVWSIEWVDSAGKSSLQHDCPAEQSIRNQYEMHLTQSRNAQKRSLKAQGSEMTAARSKRRHLQIEEDTYTAAENVLAVEESIASSTGDDDASAVNVPNGVLQDSVNSEFSGSRSFPGPKVQGVQPLRSVQNSDLELPALIHEQPPDRVDRDQLDKPDASMEDHSHSRHQPETSEDHYYLLKPSAVGASRVLIPLDPQNSLTDALRDRIVLEYPTIFRLANPPQGLPPGFLLEHQYLKERQRSESKHQIYTASAKDMSSDVVASKTSAGELDAASILEMLRRDIQS